jgi:uncharacterized membrane protein
MVAGMLTVAAAFVLLSRAQHGDGYTAAILPGTILLGLGDGLVATPLTAAVLAAAEDADLGEASAVNNAAAWVGGAIVIGVLPVLLGSQTLSTAVANGYQPAMLVMAGLSVIAAAVSALYVSNRPAKAAQMTPTPRVYGCSLPDPDPLAA